MTFMGTVAKFTERSFKQRLVSRDKRKPGLAILFKWRTFHDQATNAPRACPSCKAALHLPRNDPGFPDLLLVRDDVLIIAELKADRGRLSPEQKEWLAAFRAVKRIAVVVWKPKDWDEIERTLR